MPRLLISHFENELIMGLHKPDNQSDVKDGSPTGNGVPSAVKWDSCLKPACWSSELRLPFHFLDCPVKKTQRITHHTEAHDMSFFIIFYLSLSLCV